VKNSTIIIITGRSGSGKSTVIAALEDAGFYCVDNMPVAMLPGFMELPMESEPEIAGLAFVMDLREKGFLSRYDFVLKSLKKKGYRFEIIFLEADEETLLKRYSQTRRHHPLSRGKSLLEGIRAEENALKELRKAAHRVIDTSRYTVHELKSVIVNMVQKNVELTPMRTRVLSFGFKYGVPEDADLVMDVRFLANPYFVTELQPLDGKSEAVRQYVLSHNETGLFLKKYLDLIDLLIPLYEKEGKAYLTIAIGCTGGRHRSVTIAEHLYEHLTAGGKQIEITHRDMFQEAYGAETPTPQGG
jgi:UPF0042 nucleotide-binding protein